MTFGVGKAKMPEKRQAKIRRVWESIIAAKCARLCYNESSYVRNGFGGKVGCVLKLVKMNMLMTLRTQSIKTEETSRSL